LPFIFFEEIVVGPLFFSTLEFLFTLLISKEPFISLFVSISERSLAPLCTQEA
jgi:hypothetical protein